MDAMPWMALVLVHSPLVGPLTWRPVADRFRAAGRPTVVPDLTGVMAGPAPYHQAIAERVAEAAGSEAAGSLGRPVVLVGHSGAGPLLPAIAYELPVPVAALVYVDAGLPHPGRSWFETAPGELVAHLTELAAGGQWLPPWHQWFPAEATAELLPDPARRLTPSPTACSPLRAGNRPPVYVGSSPAVAAAASYPS